MNHWFVISVREKLLLMPLLPVVVAYIVGLILPSAVHPMLRVALGVCAIFVAFLLRRHPHPRMLSLYLAVAVAGSLWQTVYLQRSGYLQSVESCPQSNVAVPCDRSVTLCAVVADEPRRTPYGMLIDCYAVHRRDALNNRLIVCAVRDCSFIPHVGQTMLLRGHFNAINSTAEEKTARGRAFNKYLMSRGIAGEMTVTTAEAAEPFLDSLPFFKRLSVKAKILRNEMLEGLKQEMEGNGQHVGEYAVVAAMAFGERSGIDRNTRDAFSQTGTAHLLALSGMHLGILFALLSQVFFRFLSLFLNYFNAVFVRQVVLVVTVWGYVMLVGMPASVVRAAVMLTVYSVALVGMRQRMSANALFLAALMILVANPLALWDVGFELSFMAMVGIFVFFKYLYGLIDAEWLLAHRCMGTVWAMVCVTTAAQIATLPLSLYYFGRLPLLSILANIIAAPLVILLLYAVLAGMVLWWIPVVRWLMVKVMTAVSWLMTATLGRLSELPWVSIDGISINCWQLILMYVFIALVMVAVVFARHISARGASYRCG